MDRDHIAACIGVELMMQIHRMMVSHYNLDASLGSQKLLTESECVREAGR